MKKNIVMTQTMRWFGPEDPVSLPFLRMAGVSGVVSSLHHIPIGETWTKEEIMRRKDEIERHGLQWSVVESVPVHEDIKVRAGNFANYVENFRRTLINLSECGIRTVCYNFMPLLDWTRTDLRHACEDGSLALAFDWRDFAVFDIYIHERPGAEEDYPQFSGGALNAYYRSLDAEKIKSIEENILKGLPGAEPSYSVGSFRKSFERFRALGGSGLRNNLVAFLNEVVPVAEEVNVRLAIHPDDPPVPLFGLPRVVSTERDLTFLLAAVDSPANGFTFCTGSYGVDPKNDLPGMIERLGDRLYFIHLRNVGRSSDGSFVESNHLDGDVDMKQVVRKLLALMTRRGESIAMRPDHGHQMLDDLHKSTVNPGYTAIGRLRGLAELRGLELGLLES